MNIADPGVLRGEQRFLPIVALSLLLHAGIFAIVTGPRPPIELPVPALMATLRLIVPQMSPPSEALAHPAAAVAAAQPKARQSSPRMENRSSPRVVETAAPTSLQQQETAPVPAGAIMNGSPPGPVASAPVVPAAEAQPVRPQSELLAGYRQRLAELFARHQEYPRIAAMRGWEGEVRLRLRVARKGNLLAVQVDRSSGFEVLDQHALAMLEGLPGLPPLPDGVDGNEIQVVVPVNYTLKKAS